MVVMAGDVIMWAIINDDIPVNDNRTIIVVIIRPVVRSFVAHRVPMTPIVVVAVTIIVIAAIMGLG